jgi:thiol-disulfide isomerase/thioredoxin
MSDSVIVRVSEFSEYKDIITTSSCAVKFTATWCGPCRIIAPTFHQLAKTYDGIKFLEIDIDEAQEITDYEDVKSIPYVVFYSQGKSHSDLSCRGADKNTLLKNIEEFVVRSVPKEPEPVVVVPPSQQRATDMSRLTLDDIEYSDSESDESTEEQQEEEEQQHNSPDEINEYGEEVDIVIEKTIPSDMIKTEGLE